MYRLDISISVLDEDGKILNEATGFVDADTLEEVKNEERGLILWLAEVSGICGRVLCDSVIENEGKYVDSDEDFIVINDDFTDFDLDN